MAANGSQRYPAKLAPVDRRAQENKHIAGKYPLNDDNLLTKGDTSYE